MKKQSGKSIYKANRIRKSEPSAPFYEEMEALHETSIKYGLVVFQMS